MSATVAAAARLPASVLCSSRSGSSKSGNFGHFVQVVKKDVDFLKKGFSRGINWTGETLRISEISKKLDHWFWLRNLEDPNSGPFQLPSWPQPYYPELSSVDLFLADLKALEAYVNYFYCLSKMWKKPLPEVYDPQEVDDYFNCRPHVVAFRLIEVFASFASAAIRIRLSALRKSKTSSLGVDADGYISQYNFGMMLKETMLNLGPTFIKVGQSLSTRPDIIGFEMSKALSGLHDQIPPFPRALAMKIIEEELGSPVETFFCQISEEAVAAASFGQVYRANTIDGYDVAVKVQRPDLRHVVVRDIYILRSGLGLLQKIARRKSDLRLYADELGKGLVGELDYTLEAANALEFMEAHSPFPFIRVPRVFQHLSRKRVLTMEWMAGDNPKDLQSISSTESVEFGPKYSEKQQNDARRRLLDLVNKGVEASLIQLIETGLLHADPHPGNLRYLPSGQIGFLDFGLMCRMEKKHKFAMLASIIHIVNGDWASLVGSLTEMDVIRPGTSLLRVTLDLEDALEEVEYKDGIPDIRFSRVLSKIWSIALKYHFRMPAYYTLLLRSLASLEGLAMAGDPNFKTFEAAYPYVVHKLLNDNSIDTRRILQSVVLNKKREFQWQRLGFFLRIGATRKELQHTSKVKASPDYSSNGLNGISHTTNLVLRLLLSKEGVVVRRLLMTADGASLIKAFISREASTYRQQLCTIIADVLYQSMCETLGKMFVSVGHNSRVRMTNGIESIEMFSSSRSPVSITTYQTLMRDRRLKVILLKVLKSGRKDPVLMMKLCWISFLTLVAASSLAVHRVFVAFSEVISGHLSFSPKKLAEEGGKDVPDDNGHSLSKALMNMSSSEKR